MRLLTFLLLSLLTFPSLAGEPQLSQNAPKDRPRSVRNLNSFDSAIAPYVAQAKSSYPSAKARFLAGLPDGQIFFITTRIHDSVTFEQSFIRVISIEDGIVHGTIANDINRISGYKNGDSYSFPESELLDWLITYPDGTEEGNFVGKFLDGYHGGGA